MLLQVTVVCLLLHAARTQDCKTSGEQCDDDKDCCGGCCRSEFCIDTYDLCILVEDPCESHYCPPGFECYLYQPSDCPGCEKETDCRIVIKK